MNDEGIEDDVIEVVVQAPTDEMRVATETDAQIEPPAKWDEVVSLGIETARDCFRQLVIRVKENAATYAYREPGVIEKMLGEYLRAAVFFGESLGAGNRMAQLFFAEIMVFARVIGRLNNDYLRFGKAADPGCSYPLLGCSSRNDDNQLYARVVALAKEHGGTWLVMLRSDDIADLAREDPIALINNFSDIAAVEQGIAFNSKLGSQQLNMLKAFFRDA